LLLGGGRFLQKGSTFLLGAATFEQKGSTFLLGGGTSSLFARTIDKICQSFDLFARRPDLFALFRP
jgi:hypothetical protein